MGSINVKDVVNTALSEVGYQGESKNSKFTQYLDSRQWYNYPKAGACTWCAIFYDYCVAVNEGDLTDEQARQVVCEPADHNANAGAGCVQKAQMYKDHGRWISKVSDCTTGDQVFFKKSNGQIYHTGIVVDWDNIGIYTVEGSTDGGKVTKRHYGFTDPKLAGFGRPDWYKYQDSNPEPTPEPDPEPQPTPEPTPEQGYPGEFPTLPDRGYFQKNDEGAEVKKLQSLLEWLVPGCLPQYGVDGEIGDETIKAVKSAQALLKVTVDGFYGAETDAAARAYTKDTDNQTPAGKKYTVSVNSFLNVRSGPGKNYPSIGQLYNGNQVTVYEESNGWGRIGEGRWVCMDYLK